MRSFSLYFFPISPVVDLPWIWLNRQKLDDEMSANFASNIRQIWNYSIHLNLGDIISEICKPCLIINAICMLVNLGNVQGIFFVVSTEADYNRLQTYKKSQNFCEGQWWRWWWDWGWVRLGLRLSFERSKGRGERATKIEQVWTRGEGESKYRALCDKVITECPLL